MSDELTPVETDQTAPVTPDEPTSDTFTTPPPDDSPHFEDFKRMQADYTRKTQSLAEQRKEAEAVAQEAQMWERLQTDPEFQREALQQLGYEVPTDDVYEPDAGNYYEPEPYISDLTQKVEALTAAEQERQAHAIAQEIHQHIDQLTKDAKVDLTPWQRESIFRAVVEQDPSPARTEEVVQSFTEDLRAQEALMQQRWLASKQTSHVAPGGEEGTNRFNIRDKDARIKRLAAHIEAGNQVA